MGQPTTIPFPTGDTQASRNGRGARSQASPGPNTDDADARYAAALKLVEAMKEEDRSLSAMARFMTVYPQTLINVPVNEKPAIATLAPVTDIIREEEQKLGDRGRVLVRYSGTQQICRVMVEGPTKEAAEQSAQNIAIAIADAIGQ